MVVDLTVLDIDDLLESLEYSKERVGGAAGTPYEVRQEKLARLDTVAAKLREAKQPPRRTGKDTIETGTPEMPYERPRIDRKPNAEERRQLLQDYVDHYAVVAKDHPELLNQKLPRLVFGNVLDRIGGLLLKEAHKLAKENTQVRDFLADNPPPPSVCRYLSDQFRAFCLLLNSLKQWVSAEQAATDRYFLAGNVRTELRSMLAACIVTGDPLESHTVTLHHPVRDGRPPLPISKKGHAKIEEQTPKAE